MWDGLREKIRNLSVQVSIKRRIFLSYVIVLFITVMILGLFSNRIFSQAIITKATGDSVRELALVDRSIGVLIDNVENYTRIVAIDTNLQTALRKRIDGAGPSGSLSDVEFLATLSHVLSNIAAPNTYIAAANIMTMDRRFTEAGDVVDPTSIGAFDEAYLDKVLRMQTPVWTNLIRVKLRTSGDEDAFAVAKTIIDFESGRSLGIVFLYLKEKDIQSIYQNDNAERSVDYYIVDPEGMVLSSNNKSLLYGNIGAVNPENAEWAARTLQDGTYIDTFNGRRMLTTVLSAEKTGWRLVRVVPLDEITVETRRINLLIFILGLICLLGSFFASYLLSHTITKPILKLVGIMRHITTGRMDLRADFKGDDEIALLGDGLNQMMNQLEVLVARTVEEQKARREYEFRLLQSQIKPHFLYNTIETIMSFIRLDMKENALVTAKYLARFYRISLSQGKDIITIGDEMQLTESYLQIQKLRYNEYMDFEIDVEERLLEHYVPKLTLQPLVENAIYHGLKPRGDKGYLRIEGRLDAGRVLLTVTDNGVGMTADTIRKVLDKQEGDPVKEGFGLISIRERIQLMYGPEYGLSIESEPGSYTKVTVQLPMQ